MNDTTKKCPMCAEEIPLAAVTCEYCGAQFEVTSTGYCQNCHQVRDADENGQCRVCGNIVVDLRVESRFREEQIQESFPVSQPIAQNEITKTSKKRLPFGLLVGILIFAVIGVVLSFGRNSIPTVSRLLATITPTATTTFTPTSTSTVTPTRTPRPTPTATPLPTWVTDFAQPILSAIASQPTVYQDDFSNPNSGWGSGWHMDGWFRSGEYGYQNGEYFIVADPAIDRPPNLDKLTCNSINGIPTPNISDFVLEIEGRFVSGTNGIWQIHFRRQGGFDTKNVFNYSLFRKTGGDVSLLRNEKLNITDLPGQSHAQLPPAHFTDTDFLQIIARGSRFAVLLNEVPLIFTNDPNAEGHNKGKVFMQVCNGGDEPMRVQFDNLKIWDLSNIQIP